MAQSVFPIVITVFLSLMSVFLGIIGYFLKDIMTSFKCLKNDFSDLKERFIVEETTSVGNRAACNDRHIIINNRLDRHSKILEGHEKEIITIKAIIR